MSRAMSDPSPSVHVLVVAAGRGSRFGGPLPKQYCDLAGEPVLRRTVGAFLAHPAVSGVRVMIHPDDRRLYDAAVGDLGLPEPVHGGATRQASVLNGLEALASVEPDLVLIHDAARPLISAGAIDRLIASLAGRRGAWRTSRHSDGGVTRTRVREDVLDPTSVMTLGTGWAAVIVLSDGGDVRFARVLSAAARRSAR